MESPGVRESGSPGVEQYASRTNHLSQNVDSMTPKPLDSLTTLATKR